MGVVNDFSSASRWGKLVLAALITGIALLCVGFFTLDWAAGHAVEARDFNKNVMYSKNLSDVFDISSKTGLWEFCTNLTFKKKGDSAQFFYKNMLQKSVSGCRRINVVEAWLKAVQVFISLSLPLSGLSVLCICLYIFNPEKHRVDKTAIATGAFSFATTLFILVGVFVFGIRLGAKGLELSQFDCYYLDNFVFAASDLSWSFWVTGLSAVMFAAASVMGYFLTLRTRQRERMRRRSETRSNNYAPQLLQTQSSQISGDSVFSP